MKNQKLIVRIICILLVLLMLFSLVSYILPTAFADELDDLKAQKEEATTKLSSIKSKLKELKNEQGEVIEEKLALEEQNTIAKQQIETINKEIALYSEMIRTKGYEVDAAQEKEAEQLEKYRDRVRAMEENGDYNILALVLNAKSFSSLLAAIDDYGDVMDSDKTLYDQLISAREELEDVKADYEEYKDECETTQAELEKEQQALEEQICTAEARLAELASAIEDAEEEAKAAETAIANASASITAFLQSYTPATNSNFDYSVTGSGSFVWPFPASNRISSTMKQRWGRAHTGVDVDAAGASGCPIVAADGGTVILSSWYGGYGNCVIIDHNNGYKTLYGHMSSLAVSEGQSVSAGQTIGIVGMTGSATGEHLHFELFVNGSRVNPLDYYSGYELEPGAADES